MPEHRRILRPFVLCVAAMLIVLLPGVARSHAPWKHEPGELAAPKVHHIGFLRGETNRELAARCRPAHRVGWSPAWRVPAAVRPWVVELWRGRRDRARAASSRCLPGWPWSAIVACEAAGYGWPLLTTWNGYYFALQFARSTWNAYRGDLPRVSAYLAAGAPPPPRDQVAVAERVLAAQSWEAWPTCARRAGLIP